MKEAIKADLQEKQILGLLLEDNDVKKVQLSTWSNLSPNKKSACKVIKTTRTTTIPGSNSVGC